ncbi:MAG: hypothetical protein BroJett011_54310 [Chloroflexota bacterium]|nr:MAG: hypothetical protein BroJett011_54310 [Chloroflexota bacterium]
MPSEVVMRGTGEVAAETLIERAEEIADVSAGMVDLAREYLESPDATLREGISGQLLAQAAAELQVATELFQIATDEEAYLLSPAPRAAGGVALHDAINTLEQAMATPVSAGLGPPVVRRAAAATPDQAKGALQQAVLTTTDAIMQRVIECGGDMTFNLVFNTEWAAVIQGAGLVSQDMANLLDKVKEGAGVLFQRAVTVATKTLLNVYDKILALLGKQAEDQARQQIRGWLEEIKQQGRIELFESLVGKLYGVEQFKAELPGWLQEYQAGPDRLSLTTAAVKVLSDKFIVLVGRLNTLGDVVSLARFIQAPQILVVSTGLSIALLAVLVYAGYDYIGYHEPRFPNLTKGVAEVIRENLRPV